MTPERFASWQDARSILCVRLDNLGDVLMTTPAIRALKTARPHRKITLLASASGVEAANHIPEVDEAIRYDAPWSKHAVPPPPTDFLEMRRTLDEKAYDAAVIFTVYSQNPMPAAMLAYLAGIPLRLAYCRENPYHLLTDWMPETEPAQGVRHEAQRQLDLVRAVGARTADTRMNFSVPHEAEEALEVLLDEAGLNSPAEYLVVLHPGATAESRRYPAERFAEVARQLTAMNECQVVVTGSSEERELTRAVCEPSLSTGRIHDFGGRLSLAELGALIAKADVLISNNTGPVHIASAVGTPVVDLYALTNPQHTPWQVPNRVLFKDVPCKYCYKSACPKGHHECLRGVPVESVVTAAMELLDNAPSGRPVALPGMTSWGVTQLNVV
jgi:lipopolysaccharide heptosyltransferase II